MSGLTIKFFAGFELSPELKFHLEKNKDWKQAAALSLKERDLITVRHQGLEYIGKYMGSDQISLKMAQQAEDFIRQRLQFYCPKCNLEKAKTFVFPQTFIM